MDTFILNCYNPLNQRPKCRACRYFGEDNDDIPLDGEAECMSAYSIHRGTRRSHNDESCDSYELVPWVADFLTKAPTPQPTPERGDE